MSLLQLLFRASPAALLLLLCLQQGITTAQENGTSRRAIILDLDMPEEVEAGEEVTVKATVQTELRECMVIKAYLLSSIPVDGPFNYKFTACLCEDNPKTFYWDFQAVQTTPVASVIDVVRETNICPDDEAVVPIKANRYYTIKNLTVN